MFSGNIGCQTGQRSVSGPMPSSPNKDIASFTAKRFRVRYVVALALIATLTLISQIVIQNSLANQVFDSRVVNIAGRQRMLSQKITKTSYFLLDTGTATARQEARAQLRDALALWQRSHEGLQRGDSELGLPGGNSGPVTERFATIELDYRMMVDAVQNILAAADGSNELTQEVRRLTVHEASFLRGMDAIVFLYDDEAKQKVRNARYLELGLGIVTLLVLLLEARLIFAPAVRRLRHDMRQRERQAADMERLFDASPTAMFLMDETSVTIVRVNRKAETLLGWPADELSGRLIGTVLDAKFDANRAFLEKVRNGDVLNEYEVLLVDAHLGVVEALASSCRVDYADRPSYVIGITDISELKKAQRTLQYYATFDELTGLINRRTGLLMLASDIDRSHRDQHPLSVCFVDLDGLKSINDLYGHHEGDWMIHTLAAVLQESTRGGDIALRLGGDEFLLILHDCIEVHTARLIARIEQRLAQVAADEGRPYRLSASFGVAVYDPTRHTTPEDLIAEADQRMYEAKSGKRATA
jgi:diguanylate cyclase (GGDEF)-like protein/PAS domain S-box-containing protein